MESTIKCAYNTKIHLSTHVNNFELKLAVIDAYQERLVAFLTKDDITSLITFLQSVQEQQ